MNFAAIYGEVVNNFSPDWTARVKQWVNASYHDVISRKLWSWTERVGQMNAVAGQSAYSLVGNTAIPDFRALIDITIQGPAGTKPMLIDAQRFDELTNGATAFTASVGAQTLPTATLNVATTAGFPVAGFVQVGGAQLVNYTGLTSTSFTGATGGTGSVAAGSMVRGVITGLSPIIYAIAGDYPPETTSAGVVAGGLQSINFSPAFSAALTNAVRVRYYRGAGTLEMTNDSDVPMIPTRHHFLLVEMGNAMGYNTSGAYLQAQEWSNRAEQRIQQMIAEDAGMRHGDEDELTVKPVAA